LVSKQSFSYSETYQELISIIYYDILIKLFCIWEGLIKLFCIWEGITLVW